MKLEKLMLVPGASPSLSIILEICKKNSDLVFIPLPICSIILTLAPERNI
jgi:hypothetical protein